MCGFIGTSIIGVAAYRTPFLAGLVSAIVGYVLTLIGVFIVAFVIDALAPIFGGAKNFISAMKVAAYAPTAAWLASVFTAVPVLTVLAVLGLYSFYLFYLGLPVLMRVPPGQSARLFFRRDGRRDHRVGDADPVSLPGDALFGVRIAGS